MLRGAHIVLAVSDGVAARVRELGAPADRVHTTGNGVDTRIYTAEGPAGPKAWDARTPYAVYAGTMSSWQGADVFLRGFALATDRLPPDARLVFVGQGTERRALQQMAERLLPGRVDFPGLVAPEEAACWLRGAHAALVSIVPDRGYDFARPTKIWAAAACGTPVVFAGRGAGAELVRELDAGTAVDHDDALVASALVAAFTDPVDAERREAMAGRARREGGLDVLGQRAAAAVLDACQ